MRLRLLCCLLMLTLFPSTMNAEQADISGVNHSIIEEFKYIEGTDNVKLDGFLLPNESNIIMYGRAFVQTRNALSDEPIVGVGWLHHQNVSGNQVNSILFDQNPNTSILCISPLKEGYIIGVEKSSNAPRGYYLFCDSEYRFSDWYPLSGSVRTMIPVQDGMLSLGVELLNGELFPQCALIDSNGVAWIYTGKDEDRGSRNYTTFEGATAYNDGYALICKKQSSFSIRLLDRAGRPYLDKPISIKGNPINIAGFSTGLLLSGSFPDKGTNVSFIQYVDSDGNVQWHNQDIGIRLLVTVINRESSIFAVGYGLQDDNLYLVVLDKEGNILSSDPLTAISPIVSQGMFENICAIIDPSNNLYIGAIHRKPNRTPRVALFRIVKR